MKILLFSFSILFLFGCVNKHGVSLKYYSDCKEYYDYQGYYHKECADNDIFTYKGVKKGVKDSVDYILGEDLKPVR
jgi:hypothetical protein